MTGETANGKSISVISMLLPWNSNLAMAQAAAMPNTVLTGTTMAAVSNVNLIDGLRIRIAERIGIDAPALFQRLHQHGAERRQQQQSEECDGNEDQRDAAGSRTGGYVLAIFEAGCCAGHVSVPPR